MVDLAGMNSTLQACWAHGGIIVTFVTIQFNVSHLFAHFKCQTVLFDLYIGPYQVVQLQVRVGLGAMAMKRYFTFS